MVHSKDLKNRSNYNSFTDYLRTQVKITFGVFALFCPIFIPNVWSFKFSTKAVFFKDSDQKK